MSGENLERLKAQAKRTVDKPKLEGELSLPTDILVVFPKEELEACLEALYYTLERSTSEDFDTGVRKSMLNALKRLED